MKSHPAAELFPMLPDAELCEMADDIRAHGLRQAIVTYEGKILDGRNRFEACKLAKVEPRFQEWKPRVTDDPYDFVVSVNIARRHMKPVQKAAVASALVEIFEARNRKSLAETASERGAKGGRPTQKGKSSGDGSSPEVSRDDSRRSTAQAAKAVGAGVSATKTLASIAHDAPEVVDLAKKAMINIAQAKKLADLPEEKRKRAVVGINNGEPAGKFVPAAKSRTPKLSPIKEPEPANEPDDLQVEWNDIVAAGEIKTLMHRVWAQWDGRSPRDEIVMTLRYWLECFTKGKVDRVKIA